MAMKTYNPKKVTCSLGRHIVVGYAEDSMITIDFASDGTSYVVGADGEVVRSCQSSRHPQPMRFCRRCSTRTARTAPVRSR